MPEPLPRLPRPAHPGAAADDLVAWLGARPGGRAPLGDALLRAGYQVVEDLKAVGRVRLTDSGAELVLVEGWAG